MKNKSKFKKFLSVFTINLIICIIWYMNMIYPIKRIYKYNIPILKYNVKIDISNLSTELNNIFNDIGVNNILSYFDKEVFVSSSTTQRRKRANGNISLKAKYENEAQKEEIITALNSLNLKEQLSSEELHIKYNNNTDINMDTFTKDTISLNFGTKLPYNAIKDATEHDPFVDFHLDVNKRVRDIVAKQLKYNYIIILALLITINLILYYIIYMLRQVISKI